MFVYWYKSIQYTILPPSRTSMRLDEINFELPDTFIAQTPAVPRDSCKLMVIHRKDKKITHHIFHELPDILPTPTLLVRNNSKVIPARLKGTFGTGGKWEIFFLKEHDGKQAECFVRPGRKFVPGQTLILTSDRGTVFSVNIESHKEDTKLLTFLDIQSSVTNFFKQEGEMPLPPYIDSDPEKYKDEYQTIYAKQEGSVAAPTAGLHFTEELEQSLIHKGHSFVDLTLHVGAGTFQPIKSEDTRDHSMHSEDFYVSENSLARMRNAKRTGTPLLTIGTTSSRVVEHIFNTDLIQEKSAIMGETSIYIHPPYTFSGVDMLLTNFHLPKSTLLLMVASFVGELAFTLEAYETAKRYGYKFYSFGDAMLII